MLSEIISHDETEIYLDYKGSDPITKELIHNAVKATNKLQLWDWFRNYNPSVDKGFMFDTGPNIDALMEETKEMGHSGYTFSFTLRYLQMMSKEKKTNPSKFTY